MPERRKIIIKKVSEGEDHKVIIRKHLVRQEGGAEEVHADVEMIDLDDTDDFVEETEEDGTWVMKIRVPKERPESLRPARGVSGAIGDLEGKLRELVQEARAQGYSWTQIGQALGTSKQAAWERFSGEE